MNVRAAIAYVGRDIARPRYHANDSSRDLLDVVVTDSKGTPVPGLTTADFRVTEDGKAQQIVAFSAGGHAVALTSGADNDDLVIGDTGDVNIHEV